MIGRTERNDLQKLDEKTLDTASEFIEEDNVIENIDLMAICPHD